MNSFAWFEKSVCTSGHEITYCRRIYIPSLSFNCLLSETSAKTASIVLEDIETHPTPRLSDIETHPTPRLSFGYGPSEQLVSKHSMEIMSMDEELNNFRQSWQERRSQMLERHHRERTSGAMNGEGPNSLTAHQQP